MRKICYLLLAAIVTGCAAQPNRGDESERPAKVSLASVPPASKAPLGARAFYPSTYKVPASTPTLIRHAIVLTGTGTRLDGGDVLLADGKIQAVGSDLQAPPNSRIVEGEGLWVTPGLIDVHSHLGVYPSPAVNVAGYRAQWAEAREYLMRSRQTELRDRYLLKLRANAAR